MARFRRMVWKYEEVMDGVLEEVLATYPESQLPVLVNLLRRKSRN